MVQFQLKITDYFCTKARFDDWDYHCKRLWKNTLTFYKIKAFRKTYHCIGRQLRQKVGSFPEGWKAFEKTLDKTHVLHRETFRLILVSRNYNVEQMQSIGYKHMSIHEIERFDQSTIDEFLESVFTQEEFVFAAGQVRVD